MSEPAWVPLGGALVPSSMSLIESKVLGAAAASLDFASIPSNFAHLQLLFLGRTDGSFATASVFAQCNGDTGANYYRQRLRVNNTTVAGLAAAGSTSIEIGLIGGSLATAGYAASLVAWIPSYGSGSFMKHILAKNLLLSSNTVANFFMQELAGMWASTAAINHLTLTSDGGNFAAGTRCDLYGIV